ncbi:GNAT family N-acetyltransferase [Mycobacterium kyorinense]|uniref:GNAT family N-acetyltransferase n=1 Tax=Mycobacterium kyorinense TaxID=487514 RepID=UPI0009EDAFA9|nr:GNAT family N-acetyltransferase [Mycobacterium kyorinense]
MTTQAVESGTDVELLDGRHVRLRRLCANDAQAVLALHQNLTERDRLFRFFTLHPAHLDELVRQLTEQGDKQTAIGAFEGGHLIGVASYAVSDDPNAADVAIAVAHEDHLHGVGTALLKYLAHLARSHGIRQFLADVMAENYRMLQVLSYFGWPRRRLDAGSVLHLEIDLPEDV